MKSLDELKQKHELAKKQFEERSASEKYRILVGMATCGIAAGAAPVYESMTKKAQEGGYPCKIIHTGCIGMCTFEPIVEVIDEKNDKTTYIYMTPEKAQEVMERHIKGGEIVEEYTVNSVVNKGA